MSWADLHNKSEILASEAEVAFHAGKEEDAKSLYMQAADAETQALLSLDKDKTRTIGITVVSAVSLWYKAGALEKAQQIALQWLLAEGIPAFAIDQLRYILQTVWGDLARESANIKFLPGEVFVAVKGGEVVHGGAPLDLITKKVEGIQALFYRTAEYLLGKPHRKRGGPEQDIQSICRPWLFQAAPGSYQFAVAIQEPPQQELFEKPDIRSVDVANTFLDIIRASAESPDDALENIVPDNDYRETFLKITRNLAPTGKSFNEMEIKSSVSSRPVRLVPEVRKSISKTIRKFRVTQEESEPSEELLQGILRAVHLDEDWLELSIGVETLRVEGVGETVDDVIGPMVNRNVMVEVFKNARGKYLLRDIQSEE